MTAEPAEMSAAIDRLRDALDRVSGALVSGDLGELLAAQGLLLAARVPPEALQNCPDDARAGVRRSLRRAKASLNGCRRTNSILLTVVSACLTAADVDYTRDGQLPQVRSVPGAESSLSCRV